MFLAIPSAVQIDASLKRGIIGNLPGAPAIRTAVADPCPCLTSSSWLRECPFEIASLSLSFPVLPRPKPSDRQDVPALIRDGRVSVPSVTGFSLKCFSNSARRLAVSDTQHSIRLNCAKQPMIQSNAVTAYLLQRVNALDGEWVSCRRNTFQSHESIPTWASECRLRRKLRTHSLPSGS
jgi:hypothetical protein